MSWKIICPVLFVPINYVYASLQSEVETKGKKGKKKKRRRIKKVSSSEDEALKVSSASDAEDSVSSSIFIGTQLLLTAEKNELCITQSRLIFPTILGKTLSKGTFLIG